MIMRKTNTFLEKYSKCEIFCFIIVFFVFMGSNFCKFTIGGIKFNVARILMILPILLLISDWIKNKKINFNIKNSITGHCIFFFILWCVYSIFQFYQSKSVMDFLIMNFYIFTGVINILYFTQIIDMEKCNKVIFNIINFTVFINCLYYLFLLFIQKQNVGGFYHNPNDLATVLILAIAISFYSTIKYRKKILNLVLYIIYDFVYIFSFINIMSRASLFGMIFACIIMAFLMLINKRKTIFKNIFAKCIFVVAIVLVITGGILYYNKSVGEIKFEPVQRAERSNDVRINLIFNGLYFLGEDLNIITGIGSGNTSYYLQNNSIYTTHKTYTLHNFWLEILVEYGIVVFLSFIVDYILILIGLYKKTRKDDFNGSLIYFFFWLSFIIASISSSTIITREWIWLMFAFSISYMNYDTIKKERKKLK